MVVRRKCNTKVAKHCKRFFSSHTNSRVEKNSELSEGKESRDVVVARSVELQLKFSSEEDWYTLSKDQVDKIFGSSFRFQNYKKFLSRVYPNHKWEEERFLYHSRPTRQKQLERIVRKLFPNERIIRNARKGAYMINKETNYHLEIDVWIPSLRLGFEYQDPHHYVASSNARDTLENYRHRDSVKKQILSDRGDTLIEVPCWWDGSEESLAASVHAARDDLFPGAKGDPIHLFPPPNFLQVKYLVPGVGELMLSTHLMVENEGTSNWWMSEKYDGIRGCWNPKKKRIYSRLGVEIQIPYQFLEEIGPLFLDGELWIGRGSFLQINKILPHSHSGPSLSPSSSPFPSPSPSPSPSPIPSSSLPPSSSSPSFSFPPPPAPPHLVSSPTTTYPPLLPPEAPFDWSFFRYLLFDNPDPLLHSLPFESRFSSLLHYPPDLPLPSSLLLDSSFSLPSTISLPSSLSLPSFGFCEIVSQVKCESSPLFRNSLTQIAESGGEGVVMREPKSEYTQGRTQALRTAKTTRDGYARVVAMLREEDAFEGDAQVCACVLGDGTLIECTAQRDAGLVLRVGDVVCFRYSRFNPQTGKPTLPEIYRVRYDLSWEDVVHGSAPLPKKEIALSKSRNILPSVPRGFWKEPSNYRLFFDAYANKNGFDPLNAQNWYNTSSFAITAAGWAGPAYRCAVVNAYPEVAFDAANFTPKTPKFWLDPKNVREFFVAVAAPKLNIDPLIPSSWYNISTQKIVDAGGQPVLIHHRYSVKDALNFAFPELNFEIQNFATAPKGFWEKRENCRKFFDNFARQNSFDPLVPKNWYPITRSQIVRAGGRQTLFNSGESHRVAIASAYPEIDLQIGKWHNLPTAYSKQRQNYRNRVEIA